MLKSILLEVSTTQMNFEGMMCLMSTNPMIEQTLFGSFLANTDTGGRRPILR